MEVILKYIKVMFEATNQTIHADSTIPNTSTQYLQKTWMLCTHETELNAAHIPRFLDLCVEGTRYFSILYIYVCIYIYM